MDIELSTFSPWRRSASTSGDSTPTGKRANDNQLFDGIMYMYACVIYRVNPRFYHICDSPTQLVPFRLQRDRHALLRLLGAGKGGAEALWIHVRERGAQGARIYICIYYVNIYKCMYRYRYECIYINRPRRCRSASASRPRTRCSRCANTCIYIYMYIYICIYI